MANWILAAAKDCGIVFLLNQSQQSSSLFWLVSQSQRMSAIFEGTYQWISLTAASADPVLTNDDNGP